MFSNLNGWHLLIVILVVLLIFGAPKLPGLARSLGQSMRIFRSEVKAMKDDDTTTEGTNESAAVTASPSATSGKASGRSAKSAKGAGSGKGSGAGKASASKKSASKSPGANK